MILRWQFDPVLIGGLLALSLSYGLVVGPLRRRLAPDSSFPARHVRFFFWAIALVFLAEASPLHDLAEFYLFSAHMVQHVILSYVVPPLLIAGLPHWLWRVLLLNRWVKPVAHLLTRPVVALLIFSFAFSIWHIPAIYEGALKNSMVHHLEHLIFIISAIIMWWPLMSPLAELPRLDHGWQVIYLFVLPIGQFLAPAFLTFASVPFYQTYIVAPRISGLSALADQQLGGVIMKVAGFFAFGIPLALAFFRWYSSENPPSKQREIPMADARSPRVLDDPSGMR